MSEYILEMRGIVKTFPGVKALDDVNIRVRKGEIHSLCLFIQLPTHPG